MILNVIAFIFTVVGTVVMFDAHSHAQHPKPNMYTLHSWIGLAAIVLFALQVIDFNL